MESMDGGKGGPDLTGPWWATPVDDLTDHLGVDRERGLDSERVQEMRSRYGRPVIRGIEPKSMVELLRESITSPMMLLLLAIAGISAALRQLRAAAVMVFVVLCYIGVELINKGRTDRTLARLRGLQRPESTVLRSGKRIEIPIDEVVVGDLLPLSPGSSIPADARLISSVGLLVNEAPLTGESTPQPKDARATVGGETPLAERVTAVFAGTTVIDGEGMALVAAIGSQTELGHVAELAAGAHEQRTPLQAEMDDLTRTLAYVAIGVSLIIPGIGWLRGQDLQEMVLTWLSLTFLMVPGQPPIIITMALALAAFELARRGVIVRRLAGAETLGSVDTLLSDKTGTMTANEMVLERILLGDGTSAALDDAVAPGGERMTDPDVVLSFMRQALPALPTHSHDPTDLAVVQAAANLGLDSSSGRFGELVDEIGFSRSGTYRGMVYMHDGERQRYVAGRPEFVIERATQWRKRDEVADWASGESTHSGRSWRRWANRESASPPTDRTMRVRPTRNRRPCLRDVP